METVNFLECIDRKMKKGYNNAEFTRVTIFDIVKSADFDFEAGDRRHCPGSSPACGESRASARYSP